MHKWSPGKISYQSVGRCLSSYSSHITEADKIGFVPSSPNTLLRTLLEIDLYHCNKIQCPFHKYLTVASVAAALVWLLGTMLGQAEYSLQPAASVDTMVIVTGFLET